MVTLALSVSSAMIETFMDLLNYPPSATLQLMLRTLPYINCALAKPVVYLVYYHEIFPKRKQIFQRSSRSTSLTTPQELSRNVSESRIRPRIETNDSEMTTEEISFQKTNATSIFIIFNNLKHCWQIASEIA